MSVRSQSPEMWYAPKAQSTKLLQSALLWSGKVREKLKFLKFREKSGEIIDIVKARGGGGMPYMGYIGMCCWEGYGFQAKYSRIGYINQSIWL